MKKRNKKTGRLRLSGGSVVFDIINNFCFIIFSAAVLYPFVYLLALSFNDGMDALKGGITIWPRIFTLENYQIIFSEKQLTSAVFMSVSRTILGTLVTLVFTILVSYCFTRREMLFFNAYLWIIMLPMYVSAGLIPTFLVYRALRLTNTFWVYILPNLVWASNVVIMRTMFDTVPASLHEAAVIDGAGDMKILIRVIVPLSFPVIATIALFNAVWHWNSWYDTVMFTRDSHLDTLMSLLSRMLMESQSQLINVLKSARRAKSLTPEVLKAAMTIVTVVPIIIVYPFLQKYFVKGIMVGAIKE